MVGLADCCNPFTPSKQTLLADNPVARATFHALTLLRLDLQADVAILDEIDSGLDVDALRDVATAVNGLKSDNNAVLMSTHYQV